MLRLEPVHLPTPATDHPSRSSGATRTLRYVLSALLCLSAAACGGDDSDDNEQANTGTAGTAAGGGGGGAGGSTTPPPPMPVACGAKMCFPPTSPISSIANMFGGGALAGAIPQPNACCLDEATEACGVSMSAGATCEALATPDTRCPKANLGMFGAILGGSIQPCCIDNQCGQDGRIFGRGCVENSSVMSMLGPLGAIGMFQFPAKVACDAVPPPTMTTPDNDDAGVPGNDTDAGT